MSGARRRPSGSGSGASGSGASGSGASGPGFRRTGPRSPDKKFREHFHYHTVAEISTHVPEAPLDAYTPELMELGNFSRVGERDHVNGYSKSAFLIEPGSTDVLNWDLNVAFGTRTPKDPAVYEKIDHLLRWITENADVFREACGSEELTSLHTEFICYRSLLARIMSSVHEHSKGWVMGATKYRDTIYMAQYKPGRRSLYTDEKRKQVAWRHKFEQYMTANRPLGKPTPEAPVNETEVTYTVTRTHFTKHHSIIFAARVVATDPKLTIDNPEMQSSPRRFVELRVARRIDTKSQQQAMFRKMFKWWCQAKIQGIPRILCGYRDDNGVVENVRSYSLHTLEELGRPIWKGTDALSFLRAFLEFVLQQNAEENRRKVVLYEFNPETRRIKTMVLPHNDPNYKKYQVLPDWYVDDMEEIFPQE